MTRFSRATTVVFSRSTLLRPALLFAVLCTPTLAVAAEISGGGAGAANFTCNAELGICECEGDRNSVDCKAMRRNCKDIDDLFSTEGLEDQGKLFCFMSKQDAGDTRPGSGRVRRDAQRQAVATRSEQRTHSTRAVESADDHRKPHARASNLAEISDGTSNALSVDTPIISPNNRNSTVKQRRDPPAAAAASTIRQPRPARSVRDHRTSSGKDMAASAASPDCRAGSEKLRRSGYHDIIINECDGPEYTYTARSGTGMVRARMDVDSGEMTITYLGIADPN